MTVTIALFSLVILGCFVLSPIVSKESTVEQTKTGLDMAINKIQTIREELKRDSVLADFSLNP